MELIAITRNKHRHHLLRRQGLKNPVPKKTQKGVTIQLTFDWFWRLEFEPRHPVAPHDFGNADHTYTASYTRRSHPWWIGRGDDSGSPQRCPPCPSCWRRHLLRLKCAGNNKNTPLQMSFLKWLNLRGLTAKHFGFKKDSSSSNNTDKWIRRRW